MIINQLKEMEDFTDIERSIAEYILQNISEIHELSAQSLANNTFSSKASVIRLTRKVGANSYKDFKRILESEITELYRISGMVDDIPIKANSTYKEIINIVPSIYETAVTQTKLNLDHNVMVRVINQLSKSSKISLYGIGITHTLARAAAFKFMTLGIESQAYAGINEHYVVSKKENIEETIVVISFTGGNKHAVEVAKYMKGQKNVVIGIGGNDQLELKPHCSEYIELDLKNFPLVLRWSMLSFR